MFLPDQALGATLAGFNRRLGILALRAGWSSAAQTSFLDYGGGAYVSVQDWGSPSYPSGGATMAVGVTLDPGRWVLLASVVQQLEMSGSSGGEIGVAFSWSDSLVTIPEEQSRRSYFPTATIRRTFTVSLEVVSELESTAIVEVFAGAEPGYTSATYRLYTAYIVAFPG
jgi:hypothetical protein